MVGTHHYAIDAARLVEKCRSLLHSILDVMESKSSPWAFQRRAFRLAALSDALKCVDRLIHTHLLDLLDREMEFLSSINEGDAEKRERLHQFFGEHVEYPTLMDTVKTLQCAERVARDYRRCGGSDLPAVGFDGTAARSIHKRNHSVPEDVLSGRAAAFLSIDDPVEDEGYAQGWYAGSRRSPSPPPLQSAGERSPPQTHRRSFSAVPAGVPALPTLATTPSSSPARYGRSNGQRSAVDSNLFRLIVTLQLCLVRIEEANSVLCNGEARAALRCTSSERRSRAMSFRSIDSGFDLRACASGSSDGIRSSMSEESELYHPKSAAGAEASDGRWRKAKILAMSGILGGTYFLASRSDIRTDQEQARLLKLAGKVAVGVATASLVRKRWRILCMNARMEHSSNAIEDWIFEWICLVNKKGDSDIDSRYKRLIAPRKPMLWYSNGSIRFQIMKRGMDLLYASIGKAVEITKGQSGADPSSVSEAKPSGLWTYVVASLAASYYNVIGPGTQSASSLATAPSSVIQNAWGMVSLPAVKKASLEATRILKGAAIADRIEICGVSCFVLSREAFPALSSALRRFRRQQEREDVRLGTIHESVSSHNAADKTQRRVKGFQQKDVILHLTGGGFFAHTIAGDLPYLLDWSSATSAVVLIPEYALFPHTFPDAVTEITSLYRALRSGQAATILGFQPDHIVVSGESVGGNLAAALCVSLVSDYDETHCDELTALRSAELVKDEGDDLVKPNTFSRSAGEYGSETNRLGLELPDALMLCCPALNLSLDATPSRIVGANDPVLPSALIETISSSYLGGCPGTDPTASPFFASDTVIRNFPPTLIFTSSEDPFLDDSVAFNGRLRGVGVNSSLRAVHDLPHAFWALSTAGIPEARQVLHESQQWLGKIFSSG